VSLTPTLQRQQQLAQRRASAALAGTLPQVVLEPYRGRVLVASLPTDWRNGSASDSSPEGYAFESRIGH
jgi:hypothetical protein